MELMRTEVFAGLQVWHLMFGAIGVLVILLVVQSWMKKREAVDSMTVQAWCGACQWKGNVSKYQRKCPKCGGELQRGAS